MYQRGHTVHPPTSFNKDHLFVNAPLSSESNSARCQNERANDNTQSVTETRPPWGVVLCQEANTLPLHKKPKPRWHRIAPVDVAFPLATAACSTRLEVQAHATARATRDETAESPPRNDKSPLTAFLAAMQRQQRWSRKRSAASADAEQRPRAKACCLCYYKRAHIRAACGMLGSMDDGLSKHRGQKPLDER